MTPINNNQMSELREILEKNNRVTKVCVNCGHKQGYASFPECYKDGKQFSVAHDMQVPQDLIDELLTLISHERAEAVDWATGDDTGVSSKALMRYMLGLGSNSWGFQSPSDADDRGRCIRLLVLFPEWLSRLDEMKRFWKWEEQIPLIRKEYEEYLKEQNI